MVAADSMPTLRFRSNRDKSRELAFPNIESILISMSCDGERAFSGPCGDCLNKFVDR